ncbi:MAG: adenylosuccinate lyase [Roseiflexaceae bacterium]
MTDALSALSPLDGRYHHDVAALESYFSEAALYRYRIRVEIEYLILLSRTRGVGFVAPLDAQAAGALRDLYRGFSTEQAMAVAAWDRKVNHDVKAVEYWIREQLDALGLGAWKEAVHFGLTSEDVNNLAYALMLREARDIVLVPAAGTILAELEQVAHAEAQTAMLARTHGQAATPTTFGKEVAVFAARIRRVLDTITAIRLTGKLNGATGTFAAHHSAIPDVDWITFSRALIKSLDLEPILLTTQIEPHDTIAELCDGFKRLNTILIDLCQDYWRYISDGYLAQASIAGEVGSSTMPHKVNPIDFENAEGNFGIANALWEHFARKLPISRLQRDLTDSTALRNLGVAAGHSLLGYKRLLKGLGKVRVVEQRLLADLQAHPEVLAEAVQTILRRIGYPEPYEALKKLTRGQALTLTDLNRFVDELDIDESVKAELRALTPEGYIGRAADLVRTLRGGGTQQW